MRRAGDRYVKVKRSFETENKLEREEDAVGKETRAATKTGGGVVSKPKSPVEDKAAKLPPQFHSLSP
ncbi:hypothetical protein QJS10_CPB11g01612 [Acorus calamus]|uniref:Uncharacterized protein n=1 Tax=Acorus calamus TaxID=4465 RepID=A0AAV9DWB4_ACOCL|nr:hypothetical protein QJS10_CPB11g01612 [Acorus calamus]